MRRALFAAALLCAGTAADAAGKYDWDALGAEFCRLTVTGDLPGLRPILSDSLAALIQAAAANPAIPPAQVLFQSYSNEAPVCEARTRNAALVEIHRGKPGTQLGWIEYLVMVPEADGTTRVDDVLFATRRSDTLRARLDYYASTR